MPFQQDAAEARKTMPAAQSVLIHPLVFSESQDTSHHFQPMIDCCRFSTFLPLEIDPWIERAAMNPVQRQVPDKRHQLLQQADIPIQRAFVLVLFNKLRRRFFERPRWPDSVNFGFANAFPQSCEVSLRFCELI
jgi:hypothetical protein